MDIRKAVYTSLTLAAVAVHMALIATVAVAMSTVQPGEVIEVWPEPDVSRHFPNHFITVECVEPADNLNRNRTEHPGTYRYGPYVYQYGKCFSI